MPAQYLDTCYETSIEAAQAFCATFPREVSGGLHWCESVYEESSLTVLSLIPVGSSDSFGMVSFFPSCAEVTTPMTAADGIALGWMVGGAWLAVFALLFLTRGLRGHA